MPAKKWYPIIKICPQCGKNYKMGIDGVVGGCDTCLGVERDAEGVAWMPEESSHNYLPDTPYAWTVTREDAMKEKNLHEHS